MAKLSVRLEPPVLPNDAYQGVVMALGRKPLVLNPLPDFVIDWQQPCSIVLPCCVGAEGQDREIGNGAQGVVGDADGFHSCHPCTL